MTATADHTGTDQLERQVASVCAAARQAARVLARAPTPTKDRAIATAASRLRAAVPRLIEANRADVEAARAAGLSAALVDRLTLNEKRIEAMACGLEEIARLPDPVGETIARWRRPNGLEIAQVRVPLGVVAVVYESRPNVTADAAGLCLKSGNAVVLRGGSEALRTNVAIADELVAAVAGAGLPAESVQLVRTPDRRAVNLLLRQEGTVDVVIPRGGEALIRAVSENARVPVIRHYAGVCSLYVDEAADLAMAERICLNAKVQRPGVCNAIENLLVHSAVAERFLPGVAARLREAGVELRACPRALALLPGAVAATAEDWRTEYLDLILAVKVVDSLDEAIDFINTNGSGHSDAIVTASYPNARRFLAEVDSAAVYVNASTRFTDGYEFGFGAEVGISTDRLHARGPMGLRDLTTYKYAIEGSGQVRE